MLPSFPLSNACIGGSLISTIVETHLKDQGSRQSADGAHAAQVGSPAHDPVLSVHARMQS